MNERLKFGDTFCVLPWIEQHVDIKGQKRFCCYANKTLESEETTKILRQQIWQGKKVEDCSFCYKLESHKVISPRQKESSRWLQDQDIKKHFDNKECPEPKLTFYDLRFDNKCNLACISCNEDASSLWAKELKIPIVNKETKIDLNLLGIKKIYFAGGEPLIIKKYIDLLETIAAYYPEIEVIINTNLSSLPDRFLDTISQIDNISFMISIDAYKKVNEYHRYPILWDKFYNNLNLLLTKNAIIHFNTVVDAVSVFGLADLKKLQDIPKTWNLHILQEPNWLVLKNIPKNFKSLALDAVTEFLTENKFYSNDVEFKSKIKQIQKEIKEIGNRKIFVDNINKLDLRRNIHHSDYLGFDFNQK